MKYFRLDGRFLPNLTAPQLRLPSGDMVLSRVATSGNYARAGVVMILGLILGLGATAWTLRTGYGFGALRVGPWTAWPQTGVAEIDPYARAALAKRGEAPLGRDQGLAFIATTDSAGEPLDARCEYRIVDPLPAARFWTLGLAAPDGGVLPNPTERFFFTSTNILRREGGAFEIEVARQARPGNWLSPGAARDFVVLLRLYDTPLDTEARQDAGSFPRIVKLGCP